jgi:hypothetical protein
MVGGRCAEEPDDRYSDVSEDDWFYPYVSELSEKGIGAAARTHVQAL